MIAVTLPVLLGFVAMGLDWGAVAVARIQVQAAADSAAMAATTSLGDSRIATQRARLYAQSVQANGLTPDLTELDFGEWDEDTKVFDEFSGDVNAVRARTAATVPMYFARLFGVSEVVVTGEAGAGMALPGRAPDMVLVLDVTGSMSHLEIQYEKLATEALIDCVSERSSPESRASIVLFTGVDHVQSDMVDFGDNYDHLMTAAGNIMGCGRGVPCSNTNPAAGYEAALRVLEDANTPDDVGQVIVLMSDGEPTPQPAICGRSFLRAADRGAFKFPLRDRCRSVGGSRGVNSRALLGWAEQAQRTAESRDIDTFTVFYGRNRHGSNFLDDSIRAGEGTHNEALGVSDIEDAFIDICLEYTQTDAALIF